MDHNFHVYINDFEQLRGILEIEDKTIERIYVNSSVAYEYLDYISEYPKETFFIATPYVFRKKDVDNFEKVVNSGLFKGVLVRNLEVYSYLNTNFSLYKDMKLVLDSQLYILNGESLLFYLENSKLPIEEYYGSFELNEKEQKNLVKYIDSSCNNIVHSSVVYGRIPMMITANCIRKTLEKCSSNSGFYVVEDRMNKSIPVYCNCEHCYNVVYNSVPISLHKYIDSLGKNGNLRLDFTSEKKEEVKKIFNYFSLLNINYEDPFYKEYTTGHYKRGVE